jgi:hypothetical protein
MAVAALIQLADSPDYHDRAAAGRCLVNFVDDHATRAVLLSLVLDAENTFVTVETAEALLRRNDAASLAIVSAASAVAEYELADWLYGAVHSVLSVFERDRDDALRICRTIVDDPGQDDRVRTGAGRLVTALTDLRPVLTAIERP